MTRNSPLFESPARLIAIGCVLLLTAAAIPAIVQRQALLAELEQESAALHRLASQRADQHDAHRPLGYRRGGARRAQRSVPRGGGDHLAVLSARRSAPSSARPRRRR
ncbi:MAG: hypothetical protein J0I48_13170 [Devosia sp.]|nr:hypothetical protein [Devosia sp.]